MSPSQPLVPHEPPLTSTQAGSDLARLAELLAERNRLDQAIAELIGRPALPGHLGEYIAARVFGIALEPSASARGLDGRFAAGPLAGRSVNIKYYGKQENCLDIALAGGPDFYLVLTGPKGQAASSRGAQRPFVIHSVYLFDASSLLADLQARAVQLGVATSVRAPLWRAAAVYPEAVCPLLPLAPAQRQLLRLFADT